MRHDILLMTWRGGSGVLPQDLEILSIWGPLYRLHGSQEFAISYRLAEPEYEATQVAGRGQVL